MNCVVLKRGKKNSNSYRLWLVLVSVLRFSSLGCSAVQLLLPLGDPLDPDLLQEDEEGEEEDGLKLEELGPVEENFDPDEK